MYVDDAQNKEMKQRKPRKKMSLEKKVFAGLLRQVVMMPCMNGTSHATLRTYRPSMSSRLPVIKALRISVKQRKEENKSKA